MSYKVENFREKQRNKRRLQAVARTIASEVHAHKEAIELLFKNRETLKGLWSKFTDTQWQQYQNELWELSPTLGVLFRRYYDAIEAIKTKQFTLDSNIKKEFAPLEKLAITCLEKADFPLRTFSEILEIGISHEIAVVEKHSPGNKNI